jgi:hypothetical protein
MEGERQQLANLPTVVARAGTPQQDSRSLPSLGERFLDHRGPKATHRAPVNVLPASPPRGPAHESPRCILEEAQCHNPREPATVGAGIIVLNRAWGCGPPCASDLKDSTSRYGRPCTAEFRPLRPWSMSARGLGCQPFWSAELCSSRSSGILRTRILPGAPQSDRPAPTVTRLTSGEGGLSRHRYTSRGVLLGPVDEA